MVLKNTVITNVNHILTMEYISRKRASMVYHNETRMGQDTRKLAQQQDFEDDTDLYNRTFSNEPQENILSSIPWKHFMKRASLKEQGVNCPIM